MHIYITQLLLQWHYNERDGISNHRRLNRLLNSLFRRRLKKSKLRVTGLCEGNPPMTGGFPAERASNVENASISWRYHVDDLTVNLSYEVIVLSISKIYFDSAAFAFNLYVLIKQTFIEITFTEEINGVCIVLGYRIDSSAAEIWGKWSYNSTIWNHCGKW